MIARRLQSMSEALASLAQRDEPLNPAGLALAADILRGCAEDASALEGLVMQTHSTETRDVY